jgi:hypothetical protein
MIRFTSTFLASRNEERSLYAVSFALSVQNRDDGCPSGLGEHFVDGRRAGLARWQRGPSDVRASNQGSEEPCCFTIATSTLKNALGVTFREVNVGSSADDRTTKACSHEDAGSGAGLARGRQRPARHLSSPARSQPPGPCPSAPRLLPREKRAPAARPFARTRRGRGSEARRRVKSTGAQAAAGSPGRPYTANAARAFGLRLEGCQRRQSQHRLGQ